MAYKLKTKSGKDQKVKGKVVVGSDKLGCTKDVNMEKRTLHVIASDETQDRDGDIMMVKGWVLENFLKNPVFLWAHDRSSVPLASAIKVMRKRSPWRLEMILRFPTLGVNPLADMILELYSQNIINANSVGFLPLEWEDIKREENDPPSFWSPRKYKKQELLEDSGCAVPCNPAAVQLGVKSLEGSFDESLRERLYQYIVGQKIGEFQLPEDIVKRTEQEMMISGQEVVFEEYEGKIVQVGEDLEHEEKIPEETPPEEEETPPEEEVEESSLEERMWERIEALEEAVKGLKVQADSIKAAKDSLSALPVQHGPEGESQKTVFDVVLDGKGKEEVDSGKVKRVSMVVKELTQIVKQLERVGKGNK